jgi:hypothetical protein
MKRAIRRHHAARLKAKAKRQINFRSIRCNLSEKTIGLHYQVHGVFCSGFCCGNPRKFFKEKLTMREKRNHLKWISEKETINSDIISLKNDPFLRHFSIK